MQPRPESRIESLERRASTIEAAILELSSDTAEELKVIHQDIKSGFNEIGALFDHNFETLDTLATRDDLTALEGRIKEDTGTIETRLDRIETRFGKLEATQEQILKLLQQKSGE